MSLEWSGKTSCKRQPAGRAEIMQRIVGRKKNERIEGLKQCFPEGGLWNWGENTCFKGKIGWVVRLVQEL